MFASKHLTSVVKSAVSHNDSPCRSGSSVCGLPTSLCDDARCSSVGLSLFFHATVPRPGQSGMMRTLPVIWTNPYLVNVNNTTFMTRGLINLC